MPAYAVASESSAETEVAVMFIEEPEGMDNGSAAEQPTRPSVVPTGDKVPSTFLLVIAVIAALVACISVFCAFGAKSNWEDSFGEELNRDA